MCLFEIITLKFNFETPIYPPKTVKFWPNTGLISTKIA